MRTNSYFSRNVPAILGLVFIVSTPSIAYASGNCGPDTGIPCIEVTGHRPGNWYSPGPFWGRGYSNQPGQTHNNQNGGGAGPAPQSPPGSPPVAPPIATPPSDNNNKKTDCNDGGGGDSNPKSGHPVIIATGEKIKDEVDFQGSGLYPLGLTRHYHGFATQTGLMFGSKWASDYDYHLYAIGSDCAKPVPKTGPVCYPHTFQFVTPDGSFTYAKATPGTVVGPYRVGKSEAMGTITTDDPTLGWYLTIGQTQYDFDANGNILDISDASGATRTFQYSGGHLASVTGPGGQIIRFTWSGSHVSQVTDPRGQVWNYSYTPAGMLQTATSPDTHVTSYGYDATHSNWLTSISVDSAQVLAVTYKTSGQVATSGTPDGEAVDSFNYATNSTTITNQLGDSTTYGFQSVQGGLKLASVSHAGSSTCPAMAASTVFDANGWVDYTLDWRGTKTDYTYLADGRLSDMTVAYGTTTPIKHVYAWTTLANGHLKLQSDALYGTNGVLVNTTSYTYDPTRDVVTSISVKDQSTGAIATVNYGYTWASSYAMQSRTETRNLPTGAATTTYSYDSFGNLTSVVDPTGTTVTFSGYDGLGRPSAMVSANGVSHGYSYDGRGNLATDTAYLTNGNAVTRYTYDGRNDLISISLPDGSSHQFTMAPSGRVAGQTDVAGNPSTATYTTASSILETAGRAVASVSGTAVGSSISGSVSSTVQLDSLGRNLNIFGNNGQHVSYGYDANSNVTSISDALHTTTNSYDFLDRLSVTTLPDSSTIAYGYAPNGTLSSVSTSRGAQTIYTTNGFGSVTQRSSPDTGLTTYTVDPFGRATQEVRSNGTTVTYGYDGLDRLTSRTSSGNTERYTYASSGASATQLTGISNPTGSSTFDYDGYGHLNSQTDVIFGQTFATSYLYNAAGQLTGMMYPDGLSVTYVYNSAGQVTGVTPSRAGGSVFSAVYQPFGGAPYAWAYGNGATMVGSVDTDGRMTSLSSVFAKTISYNLDNTIYGISDSAYPDLNETFSYDSQSRLTATSRSGDPQSFSFDSDGNRISTTRSGVTTASSVVNGSNKVTAWTYMGGDIYSDGARSFTRDEFDRLTMVTIAGQVVGQYRYDALDRRAYKSTNQGVTYFVYAPAGQLLYEQSLQRTVNYVWLAGRLVGISVNHGALQSVHTDWLGRPELVTGTESPTVAWRASNAVFDRKVTLDAIGGLNVFFPGQYYDVESNLYYNWHRYYDPSSGRYIQSDPIGLAGGINTYAYVGGNPVQRIDPLGQAWQATFSGGVAVIVPGAGGSLNGVVGINVDGMNSSLYVQGQANGGVGGGFFAGWGSSLVAGKGDAPTTGVDSSNYAEIDAGWGPAVGLSATADPCGKITGFSAAVPYKVGAGGGVGGFGGKSYTATGVLPSVGQTISALGDLARMLSNGFGRLGQLY